MNKYRNANTNAEDFREYAYALQVLGELLSSGLLSKAEYEEVKKSYMAEYKVQNDWACRRRFNPSQEPTAQGDKQSVERIASHGTKKSNNVRADG